MWILSDDFFFFPAGGMLNRRREGAAPDGHPAARLKAHTPGSEPNNPFWSRSNSNSEHLAFSAWYFRFLPTNPVRAVFGVGHLHDCAYRHSPHPYTHIF